MSEEKTSDNIETLLYRISKIPDGDRFLNAYKKDVAELQSLRDQLAAKEKEIEALKKELQNNRETVYYTLKWHGRPSGMGDPD